MKFVKIKTTSVQKIGRTVLWIVITFVMFKGLVSIIKPSQADKVVDQVNQTINVSTNESNALSEAAAFAEAFTREYFTYKKGQGEEYKNRLLNYMHPVALSQINTSINADIDAISAIALTKEKVDNNKFNIELDVKVRYSSNSVKDIFVRVPIIAKDKKYSVDDLPFIIQKRETADIEIQHYDGNLVDTSVSKSIEEMLNNFFKVYTEGSRGEINYYLSDPSQTINGLGKAFKFKSLIDLKVYKDGDKYLAIVPYLIQDNESGQEIKQNVHMTIVNKDNRYYIEDIDTRTVNIGGANDEK